MKNFSDEHDINPMSWFSVITILEQKQCFERERTGRCSHLLKRGKNKGRNPCDVTQDMIDACFDGFIENSQGDVIDHLKTKRCRNSGCNHKGCSEVDRLVRQFERSKV